MVTVKQFLDAGFEFVIGDEVSSVTPTPVFTIDEDMIEHWNERTEQDDKVFIHSAVWRKNTGVQPVGDDCWVEVSFSKNINGVYLAGDLSWNVDCCTAVYKWKPSLKHLEQQMTDNQETKTALEMSERDIENFEYDYKPERELKESDEVAWESGDIAIHEGHEVLVIDWHPHHPMLVVEGGNGFFATSSNKLSKPETPEQKAARERMEAAYDLYVTCGIHHETISFDKFKKNQSKVWLAIVDKTGYRKQ